MTQFVPQSARYPLSVGKRYVQSFCGESFASQIAVPLLRQQTAFLLSATRIPCGMQAGNVIVPALIEDVWYEWIDVPVAVFMMLTSAGEPETSSAIPSANPVEETYVGEVIPCVPDETTHLETAVPLSTVQSPALPSVKVRRTPSEQDTARCTLPEKIIVSVVVPKGVT